MSGKAMVLRPWRTVSLLLNWDLPPVASHRYWGIRAAQMMAVFDSMAGGRGVLHDLSCAAVAVDVDLEVDDISGFGDSEVVLLDEGLDSVFCEEGEEEGGEVAVDVWFDGAVEVF